MPKDPNKVLKYEKAKYFDFTFSNKSDLEEHLSRSAYVFHQVNQNYLKKSQNMVPNLLEDPVCRSRKAINLAE